MKRGDLVRYCGRARDREIGDLGIIIGCIRHHIGDDGAADQVGHTGRKIKVMHSYIERVYFEVLWHDGLQGSYISNTLEVLSEAG